jgi:hypothetical protein
MVQRPPNTRMQRTRSSPSALRSPLMRCPLGRFIRHACVILALGLVGSPSVAEIEKTAVPNAKGIQFVWWPKLSRINGWHHDHDYSLHYAVNALAPDGRSFADAETVMYAKAIYKPRDAEVKTLDMLIARDRKMFEADSPGVRIDEATPMLTADRKKLRSFTFVPARRGNWEKVAYGEEGEFYLIFTVSSRTSTGYQAALASFEDLIRHYREAA